MIEIIDIEKLLLLDKKVTAIVVGTIIKIEKGLTKPPVKKRSKVS